MREASLGILRSVFDFLRAWRADAARSARHQYGIWLAVPIVAGCMEAHAFPRAAAPAFLAVALFLDPRPSRRLLAQVLIFIAWSLWLAASASHPRAPSGPLILEGEVRGFPAGTGRLVFAFGTADALYRVEAQDPSFPIRPGQGLRIRGLPKEVEGPTNPGQFDFRRALAAQDIAGVVRAESIDLLRAPGLWDRAVAAARDALRRGLARTVPPSQLSLFEAALLGITDGLDPAVMEDFRASGMLHILAISGQHIGILCLILLRLFSLLRLPRKAAFLITGALVAFYVPISGGSISVVRSALMYACILPSIVFERPSRGLNNLALAACLCLLWSPSQILSLGFQLSFGATFFLMLYSRPISRAFAGLRLPALLKGSLDYAWPTAALSGVIFLGLFPLLSSTVHQVSPTSIAGNLGTVGLSTGMIIAGCLALMASPLPVIGGWLGEAAGCFSALLAFLIHGLARLPGSCLSAEGLPAPWGILLLLLLLAFPFAVKRRRGLLLVLAGTALFSGRWAFGAARDLWLSPVEVAFLDVGQGDAAVLRLPGATFLLDAGPADAGRRAIVPFLRASGVNRLDLALVTHPDLDHYGGLADVARTLRIGKALGSGDASEARAWAGMRSALDAAGTPWASTRTGQYLYRYGDISLEVLSPEGPGRFRNRNDNSLVCLLRLGKERILFTGDMEREAQAWLLAHGPADLRGAVLKVPHHGSDRTTDLSFLAALAPEVAVLSAGRRNRFGHPGPGNLEALRRAGSRLFLTPREGAVITGGTGTVTGGEPSWVGRFSRLETVPGFFDNADQDRLKRIYAETAIRRVPITGIISGYHTLPFTLVGPNDENEDSAANKGSLKLTGKISVGPKLVVSLSPNDERFAEMFPESEPFMDRSLVSRVFAFSGAYKKNHRIRNEHLTVESHDEGDQELVEKVLNELSRAEIINMGVIWCPQPRFYPVSLERFIVSVLDKEFG